MEYRQNLEVCTQKSWYDVWEAHLCLAKTAVSHDGWILAAFFLPVDIRSEYVLGPHWGVQAPFIRIGYDDRSIATLGSRQDIIWRDDVVAPGVRDCFVSLGDVMFYGIPGDASDVYGGESEGYAAMSDLIPGPFPDLDLE